MPLQHEGINVLLFLGERTEGDGTGDIGGAVEVLGSAVEQQETFRFQRDVCFWRGFIVHDGAMCLIGSDGVKRDVAIEGLFGAEGFNFSRNGEFGEARNTGFAGISG